MITINLTQAKARLGELLDRVEGGEEVVITRHGRAVARISAICSPKGPPRSLAAFRATMPGWGGSSTALLTELRDQDR
jgi:prevent-host-death family protein